MNYEGSAEEDKANRKTVINGVFYMKGKWMGNLYVKNKYCRPTITFYFLK